MIVGAGIPALALAISLQEGGLSTLLLDGRKSPDTFPRGITLQPNGLEALDKLGTLNEVLPKGSKADVFEVRSWDGELLLEADYRMLDHPQNYLLTVNGVDLESVLRKTAESRGARIAWNARFKELLQTESTVTGVRFDNAGNASEANGSVVVGADGAQSPVRTAIGSRAKTTKYSDSFIAGLVGPTSELQGRARQYQSPGKMLGVMPTGPETYLFHCVGRKSFDEVKTEGIDRFKTEVSQAASETLPALEGLDNWSRLAYFTPARVSVDRWVSNGVALLGDAAHAFHPHAGQGLNLSLQDALVLVNVLTKAIRSRDCTIASLREYETKRRMFAEVISQHADYSARYALSSNWLIQRLNRRALRKLRNNRSLLKDALEITAGIFQKKPSLFKLARIGGILP